MSLTVTLPKGEAVPALGQGTWQMAENAARRAQEIEALRLGVELGMTFIDTAEMYGEGAAEELVAEALAGQRERLFLVSKVYPHNASRRGVVEACERSLQAPEDGQARSLPSALAWKRAARGDGRSASRSFAAPARSAIGASATSMPMTWRNCSSVPDGPNCATNQVLYNVTRRGPEFDLMPWMDGARHAVDGLQPDRAGTDSARRRAARRLRRSTAQARSRLPWPGFCRQAGCDRDPESLEPRAREGQLPRAWRSGSIRRILPPSMPSFRPLSASGRWR